MELANSGAGYLNAPVSGNILKYLGVVRGDNTLTRTEYENFLVMQNIDINKLNLVIGEKKVIPYVTGCFEEDGVWKIYMVGERQDFDIVQEGTEEEMFNIMHSITKSRVKCSNN